MFTPKQYVPDSLDADVLESLRAPVDSRELADIEAEEDDASDEETNGTEHPQLGGPGASTTKPSYF